MDPQRLDLSSLDPTANSERWERLVHTIMQRAAPELARRAAAVDPVGMLSSWIRPLIPAAAALAAASAGLLLWSARDGGTAVANVPGVVEALQIPRPAADWLVEGRGPSLQDLLAALEGGDP